MAWPKLDTGAWNLAAMGAGVAAMSACGPAVVLPGGGETDGDSETEDPSTATESETAFPTTTTTTTTTTTPTGPVVECYEDADCPGNYFDCVDNVCIEEYYCLDCCYDDCYYSECSEDSDCGFAALCNQDYGYGNCVAVEEIPACQDVMRLIPVVLDPHGGGEIRSLTFVPSPFGEVEDLLLGTDSSAHIVRLTQGVTPTPVTTGEEPVPAALLAGADFFGDGGTSIVAAGTAPDGLFSFWRAGDALGFFFAGTADAPPGVPAALHAARSADGDTDLILRLESDEVLRLVTDTEPVAGIESMPFAASELVVGDFDGDGIDDFAHASGPGDLVSFTTALGDYALGQPARTAERKLASGAGAGSPEDTAFAVTELDDWILVERFSNEGAVAHSLLGVPAVARALVVGAGPVDDDGFADLVLLEGDRVTVTFGDDFGPRCWASAALPGPRHLMSVGSFTGGGPGTIAVSDGSIVEVLVLAWE